MAEYTSGTIANLIKDISDGRVVLPAMQRNFVWPEEKVYHLFDSLIRDYPIGTFLFWTIDKSSFEQFVFNEFIKDIDDSKRLQRGPVAHADFSDYTAVLDGQQRITSLYVGICGKHHTHIKGRRWDDPSSYFDRFLCIDIISIPKDEEEKYCFSFEPATNIEKLITDDNGEKHYWVKIATVFDEGFDPADFFDDFDVKNPSILTTIERRERRKILSTLNDALRGKPNVNYFSAKGRSLPDVVDMFVRVNSGGQKLAASDLMLSVASGAQGNVDIHQKMQDAIDCINSSVQNEDTGFKVDKELVLTAGLLFTGATSLSLKKEGNYSRDIINDIFLSNWDNIVQALANTVQYIEHIGFSGRKLTSKNLILPVAYYFYKNNLTNTHKDSTSNRALCDIIFIRQWMLRAMINDVFMDGTGSTLIRIREIIDKTTKKYFPLDDLMSAKVKKPLDIDVEQIEDICNLVYGDVKVLPILMELGKYPPETYQVDHMWPKDLLLTQRGVRSKYPAATTDEISTYREKCHRLSNLQLLKPLENQQKSNMTYDAWLVQANKSSQYYTTNSVPVGISYDFSNFVEFCNERKKLLKVAIFQAFPSNFDDILTRFGLTDRVQ